MFIHYIFLLAFLGFSYFISFVKEILNPRYLLKQKQNVGIAILTVFEGRVIIIARLSGSL